MGQGTIYRVDGDVVEVAGLDGIAAGDLIALSDRGVGIARLLKRDSVVVALLDRGSQLVSGATARTLGPPVVPVGETLRGRVVDALGRPLDGRAAVESAVERLLPDRPLGLCVRAPLSKPLHTGIKAADMLLPLRCGGCAAVLGPPGAGKTELLLTATIAQKWSGHRCFLCLVGVEPSQLAQHVEVLRRSGGFAHTTVLAASASAPPAMQVLAPFAAMAMAGYERARGGHAVVAIDGFSGHADAVRGLIAGLAGVHSGSIRDSEVFSLQAGLLDQAGALDSLHGGGSVSALVAADERMPAAPLNIEYLVDRIWRLDAQRFHLGQRPALVPPRSVSKLALDCARPLHRLAGALRLRLAQLEELRGFELLPHQLDEQARSTLRQGEQCLHLLRQPPAAPVRLELQVALAVAAAARLLDELPLDRLACFERALDTALTAAAVTIPMDRALSPQRQQTLEALARSTAQPFLASKKDAAGPL